MFFLLQTRHRAQKFVLKLRRFFLKKHSELENRSLKIRIQNANLGKCGFEQRPKFLAFHFNLLDLRRERNLGNRYSNGAAGDVFGHEIFGDESNQNV